MSSNGVPNPALACASLVGLLDLANQGYHQPYMLTAQGPKFTSLIMQTMDLVSAVIHTQSTDFPDLLLKHLGGNEVTIR